MLLEVKQFLAIKVDPLPSISGGEFSYALCDKAIRGLFYPHMQPCFALCLAAWNFRQKSPSCRDQQTNHSLPTFIAQKKTESRSVGIHVTMEDVSQEARNRPIYLYRRNWAS